MPFIPLKFRPGLNRDQTNFSGEGGWWDCDKIRFRSGYPEKIGGWTKSTPNTFIGVCRQMWNWVTTFSDNLLALGTDKKVYIEVGGYFYDITPYKATFSTPDTDNCIETTNGSTTITVNIVDHLAITGSYVTISGVTGDVGGVPDVEINGNHVVTRISEDIFTFVVTTAATSTVSAGGGTAIEVGVEIDPGNALTVLGYGWGTDTWGRLEWGLGSSSPVNLPQRDWWFDNFDNDLVMNIRNGAVYYWQRGSLVNPDTSLTTRAVSLSSLATADGYDPDAVPAKVMQILVSQNDKHLLAFGAVPFGSIDVADYDPLLIRWADQDNPTQWTPTTTNSAGFIRVSRGSKIVRAHPTRQEILVFTDSHLYTLQFLGTTDVFNLQEYADNISIASPRAVISASNITYWMGRDKFYAYTGRVETLPCEIRRYVFEDLNYEQSDQIVCGTNEEWNEIWWFYPSANSNWNDRYVIYNHQEKIWYFGNLSRTAWLDSASRQYPIAAYTSETNNPGVLYEHENGCCADEMPLESFIQSNDFDINDGEQFMLTRRIIPDIAFDGSTTPEPQVTIEISTRRFPGSSEVSSPNAQKTVIRKSVTQYTPEVFIRTRSRQMSLKIKSEDLDVNWQLGVPRLDARADGKR
jgi:hypothetical protein